MKGSVNDGRQQPRKQTSFEIWESPSCQFRSRELIASFSTRSPLRGHRWEPASARRDRNALVVLCGKLHLPPIATQFNDDAFFGHRQQRSFPPLCALSACAGSLVSVATSSLPANTAAIFERRMRRPRFDRPIVAVRSPLGRHQQQICAGCGQKDVDCFIFRVQRARCPHQFGFQMQQNFDKADVQLTTPAGQPSASIVQRRPR